MKLGNFNWKKYENVPFVTYTLVAVVLVMYALTLLRFGTTENSVALVAMGAKFSPIMVIQHEWWRLFTAAFLHIGFQHLVLNLMTLYFIGIELEYILGHRRFAALFAGSAIGGNIFSFALNVESVSAGASTALYGMFAAFIVLAYLYPESHYLRDRGTSFTTLLVINLVYSVMFSGVDLWGHFGGLVFGAGITFIMGISQARSRHWTKMRRILMAVGLVLISFGLIGYGINQVNVLF